MKVGFTGTRNTLSGLQEMSLLRVVSQVEADEWHHGDCIGADASFHRAVSDSTSPTIVHPPDKSDLRAGCVPVIGKILPAKGYFARNRDIVESTEILIACPPCKPLPVDADGNPSGGTHYTVAYAIKRRKLVLIIWPDGTIEKTFTASSPASSFLHEFILL